METCHSGKIKVLLWTLPIFLLASLRTSCHLTNSQITYQLAHSIIVWIICKIPHCNLPVVVNKLWTISGFKILISKCPYLILFYILCVQSMLSACLKYLIKEAEYGWKLDSITRFYSILFLEFWLLQRQNQQVVYHIWESQKTRGGKQCKKQQFYVAHIMYLFLLRFSTFFSENKDFFKKHFSVLV